MEVFQNLTIQLVLYEDKKENIFRCLDNFKNFKVIILDNSNNFKLKTEILKKYKIYKYILEDRNLGYSKGHNKIAKLVDTEYLLILNADCIINEENLSNLYLAHVKYKNCAITAPTTFDDYNNQTLNGGFLPESGNRDEVVKIVGDTCFQTILGSAMLIKKKDFLDIGMFNENLFLFYSDDDLCRKFRNLKKSVIQIHKSKAIHVHGISKVRNIFKGIYLREFHMTYDELFYYFLSRTHYEKYTKLKKKIANYFFKLILNLIILNFKKSILYFSRILAFYKFNKLLRH